ncbi:MAG: hypothetical protein WC523_04865 [Patescibacteria group bacterium]
MTDYSGYSLWSLSNRFYATSVEDTDLDLRMAVLLCTINDIDSVAYQINYGNVSLFPKTKEKINSLILNELSAADGKKSISKYVLVLKWLDEPLKYSIADAWLTSCESNYFGSKVKELVSFVFDKQASYRVKIIAKLVSMYKGTKNPELTECVYSFFSKMDDENLKQCCGIINSSTPLMKVALLQRSDVSDRYILSGLKALSKLQSQKKLPIKIDFKLLEKLQPNGRLKAMQQLLGMFDRYYISMKHYEKWYPNQYRHGQAKDNFKNYGIQELPFKEIPSKEDMDKFLFPCSLKFNDKVSALMGKYELFLESINNKLKE